MRTSVKVLIVTALVASGIFTAQAAQAVAWGQMNIMDGSTQLGAAKGNSAINSAKTQIGTSSLRYDSKPGGSGIYVQADFGLALDFTWTYPTYKQSGRHYANTWSDGGRLYEGLNSRVNSMRTRSKGCMDKNNMPDKCSTSAIVTLTY